MITVLLENLRSTFKDSFLLLYLASLFIVKILIAIFVIPNRPTIFAPDEGAYAAQVDWISSDLPLKSFPVYADSLYPNIKSFINPALVFNHFGLTSIQSIRLTSISYSVLSLFLIATLLFRLHELISRNAKQSSSLPRHYVRNAVIIYGLIPSTFLWSLLGIRETTSHFWLIAAFYFSTFFVEQSFKVRVVSITFFLVSVSLGFGSRQETVIIFLISLFIAQTIKAFSIINFLKYASLIAISWILGLFFISASTPNFLQFDSKSTIQNNSTNSQPKMNELEVDTKEKISKPQTIAIEKTLSQLRTVADLDAKRSANQANASSTWPKVECENFSNPVVTKIFCDAKYLPIGLINYVFRPVPFFDSHNKTISAASFENIFWLAFLFASIRLLFRMKYLRNDSFIRTLICFLIFFSSASSLYEGNVGTAFRHRSTLYWVVLAIFTIALWLIRENRDNHLELPSRIK